MQLSFYSPQFSFRQIQQSKDLYHSDIDKGEYTNKKAFLPQQKGRKLKSFRGTTQIFAFWQTLDA